MVYTILHGQSDKLDKVIEAFGEYLLIVARTYRLKIPPS